MDLVGFAAGGASDVTARLLADAARRESAQLVGAIVREPILAGEQAVGYVTSANYGYSIGKFVAYGYLPIAYATVVYGLKPSPPA